MKNSIDIYNERRKFIKTRIELEKKLENIIKNTNDLQNECSHNIVLELDDQKPHKVGKITTCFCPACGKSEDIYRGHKIENSSFKNSKLIDLTKISIYEFINNSLTIIEHIFNNYEKYYNKDIIESEIAESLLSLIETQNKSENKPKTYKKI